MQKSCNKRNMQTYRKKDCKMKKIIVPIVTGVVAVAVGAALLVGKLKGKKNEKAKDN